jgi:hypothetical protein
MELEIERNLIPAGQFCQTVTKYYKHREDGLGENSPSILHAHCKYLELNAISGLEDSHLHPPFCWVCMVKKEPLVEKELTTGKHPVKICGIKDQPIPEDLLSLSFDGIREKSDEELVEINRKLEEYQNVA